MYAVDVVNETRGGRFGFTSSHAANSFGIATFISLLIRNRALSVSLVIWAAMNAFTRIYLGVHYPGDILFGLLVGCLSGYLCHWLLRWASRRWLQVPPCNSSSALCTPTGYRVSDVHMVMLTLLLTYATVLIIACC